MFKQLFGTPWWTMDSKGCALRTPHIPIDVSQLTPIWNPMIVCYPTVIPSSSQLGIIQGTSTRMILKGLILEPILKWTSEDFLQLQMNQDMLRETFFHWSFHRHNHWPLPKTITRTTLLTQIQAFQDRGKIQPICPAQSDHRGQKIVLQALRKFHDFIYL